VGGGCGLEYGLTLRGWKLLEIRESTRVDVPLSTLQYDSRSNKRTRTRTHGGGRQGGERRAVGGSFPFQKLPLFRSRNGMNRQGDRAEAEGKGECRQKGAERKIYLFPY